MSTKRKLEMMPEVLPAPVKRSGEASSVRSRTLARLKVLAALSATGIAASCGGKSDDDGTSSGGPMLPDGGYRTDGDPYGVVDPLPPPSCFSDVRAKVSAAYVAGPDVLDAGVLDAAALDGGASDAGDAGGADRYVRLDIDFNQEQVVISDVRSGEIVLVSQSVSDRGGSFVFRVPFGTTRATVTFRTSCVAGMANDTVTMNFQADRVAANVVR